ncbi:hypothetical protein BDQ17DRAFT_1253228 [Cyathus striatus]|nr:hypothetical protein BDQ17DRAFT_1253228 [Cyathus striatus]
MELILVCATIVHAIAILATCFHFEYRQWTHRIWWDDHVAMVTLLFECFNVILLWMQLRNDNALQHRLKLFIMMITAVSLNASACMALSIIQIIPEWSRLHRLTVYLSLLFIFIWVTISVTAVVACTTIMKDWQNIDADLLKCPAIYIVQLIGITAGIIGDIILIVLPLHRLWKIRLPMSLRSLVLIVFSSSLLTLTMGTLMLAITYSGLMEGPGSFLVLIIMTHVQVTF